MLLSLVFVFAIMSITAVPFVKNRYVMVMYIKLYSILALTISCILFISKFSSYEFVLHYDFELYLKLQRICLHPDRINDINILCHTMYLSSAIFFLKMHYRMPKKLLALISIPLLYFSIVNMSSVASAVYVTVMPLNNRTITALAYFMIRKVSLAIMITYSLIPLICILISLVRTRNLIQKNFFTSYLVCLFMTDILYQYIFLFGTFRQVAPQNLDLFKYPSSPSFQSNMMTMGILIVTFTITISIILLIFRPFKIKRLDTYHVPSKNFQEFQFENYYTTLHSLKNTLLSLYKYIEVAEKYIDSPKALLPLDYAKTQIDEQLEVYTNMVKSFKTNYITFKRINIVELLNKVIDSCNLPENITLLKKYPVDCRIEISCDETNIENCILNIIHNAVNSLKISDKDTKEITVDVIYEHSYIMIDITDNGNGIPKENQKYVFNLFFSTHANKYGSGIGLYHVKKVIRLHGGDVWFKSNSARTTFTISLPVVSNKKYTDKIKFSKRK